MHACARRYNIIFSQCIGVTAIITGVLLLFWLPFSGNFKVQSPLACLQAGGKYEKLEIELNDLRAEMKKMGEEYTTLKDKCHEMEVEMVRQEIKYNEYEKELAARKAELQQYNDLKESYFSLKLNGTATYYQQIIDGKNEFHALQLMDQERIANLTTNIMICHERLKACNDQFNVMTEVIPANEGSEDGTDQCPENDPACYYTKKAGHILQWILRLGGDSKSDGQ